MRAGRRTRTPVRTEPPYGRYAEGLPRARALPAPTGFPGHRRAAGGGPTADRRQTAAAVRFRVPAPGAGRSAAGSALRFPPPGAASPAAMPVVR